MPTKILPQHHFMQHVVVSQAPPTKSGTFCAALCDLLNPGKLYPTGTCLPLAHVDKAELISSYQQVLLGKHVNTRTMMVSLPLDKRVALYWALTTMWGPQRRSFTIFEAQPTCWHPGQCISILPVGHLPSSKKKLEVMFIVD